MSRHGDPEGWRYYWELAACVVLALAETTWEYISIPWRLLWRRLRAWGRTKNSMKKQDWQRYLHDVRRLWPPLDSLDHVRLTRYLCRMIRGAK